LFPQLGDKVNAQSLGQKSHMKRRLVGPTVVIALFCFLLLQHHLLRDKGWSVIDVLGKVMTILGVIFTPPDEVGMFFHEHLALPMVVLGAALVVLWLFIAGARRAMLQATLGAESSVWVTPAVDAPILADEPGPPPELSWALQSFRYNCLRSKLIVSFIAIGLFVAIAASSITHSYLYRAAERSTKARAGIVAMAVNATAVWHVDGERYRELREELAKVISRPAIAYAYIEDDVGKLIAHAPKDMPDHLGRRPSLEPRLMTAEHLVRYRSEIVYDHAQRSGLNNRFVVHIGVWHDSVAAATWPFLGPVLLLGLLVVACAAWAFIVLLRGPHRSLLALVEQSERIGRGDFSASVGTKRFDELGDLARSMERMRSSLRAVLARIGTAPPVTEQNRQRQSL
jgi:HAMP domain-containing protein